MAPPNNPKVMRFRLNGEVLSVEFGAAMTSRLERELFQATGLTLATLGDAMAARANFAVPAVAWLARRQAGEAVPYQLVEDQVEAAAFSEDGLELELLGDDEAGDAGPPALDVS